MSTFQIDRTLACDGLYKYSTDNGVEYNVKIHESAPGSGLATIYFTLLSGKPSAIEVFRTMNTLYELSFEYVESKGFKNILVHIDGKDREEIDKKTRIFTSGLTKWVGPNVFDYQIISNPKITVPGRRNGAYTFETNAIYMTRKSTPAPTTIEAPPNVDIKFCYNCGTENNNYKFCPKCGTNLQGA